MDFTSLKFIHLLSSWLWVSEQVTVVLLHIAVYKNSATCTGSLTNLVYSKVCLHATELYVLLTAAWHSALLGDEDIVLGVATSDCICPCLESGNVALSVVALSVLTLSVVALSVVALSVVAVAVSTCVSSHFASPVFLCGVNRNKFNVEVILHFQLFLS